ncbi:Embryo defective 2737 [Citrus sinensis]|nr:Embryo defective 2737 [Citrus sinensis]
MKSVKQFTDFHYKQFTTRHGQQLIDIFEFPIKLVLSPFTLAFDIAGSAPRGFGVPELISKLSYVSVFAVAAIGTYDIAFELGKKALSDMQRMAGIAVYHVPRISGEKATAEHVADAIADNRAELVHLPSTIDLNTPLPSKDCPTCDGTGVMGCPECKNKLQVTISADDIMEPPWKAYNVLRKMDYPYEHIVESMRDPSIAAFWLMTFPQIVGGFDFDDEVKQKIWWQYKESMRYDQLRELVAKRSPGWEHLQEALIPIDPVRAREDPVIVKNIPYYKAKKALETEVMKLDPPPRPENWVLNRIKEILLEPTVEHLQDLDLPLNASSWSEDDLKDPKKLYEKTVLLNAQREIADKMLDAQWETKWRQEKLNEMLEEKVRPFMQNIDNAVLSRPILMHPQNENKNKNQKKARQKRWWFF